MRGVERCWSKGRSFSYAGWISSGDLRFSMVTMLNNIVLYTWNLRADFVLLPQTYKMVITWVDGYVNELNMIIISQCIHISKPHSKP